MQYTECMMHAVHARQYTLYNILLYICEDSFKTGGLLCMQLCFCYVSTTHAYLKYLIFTLISAIFMPTKNIIKAPYTNAFMK